MTSEERIQAELDRDRKRWTIRRRITLACVFTNILIMLFYVFTSIWIDPIQLEMLREFNSIAIAVIGGNFSVIIAYFGLNTYEDSHK